MYMVNEMSEDSISVYCLKYADSDLAESAVFNGGEAGKKIPITFSVYLIKSGDRNILVDAGCNTMSGFVMKNYFSPVFVLRQFDLAPQDITDVIITHPDHDHIAAVKHFENATVFVTNKEYQRAKYYIPDDFKVFTFDGEYVINPQIKIIEWGGHSKGSAIVEIKLEDKIHILAGDECYTNQNIEKKLPTGAFADIEKAIAFVEKYSDNKYCVHTCHDKSLKAERII